MAAPFEESNGEPVFRAAKRRKVFRKRQGSLETVDASTEDSSRNPQIIATGDQRALQTSTAVNLGTASNLESQEDGTCVADIIRQRKLAKSRKGGIEFSGSANDYNSGNLPSSVANRAIVPANEKDDILQIVGTRFTPQIGTVTETGNQHMTTYIESELFRLRTQSRDDHIAQFPPSTSNDSKPIVRPIDAPPRQPASVGQIQEVDLGPDTSARNIARTEAAMRRLDGGKPLEEESPIAPTKTRLGRDGKPRPPPRKNRRGSEDVKRDEMVEALLRENKMDLFDSLATDAKSGQSSTGMDTALDDAMAEEFQREYLEAMASRREIRNKPPPGPASGPTGANKNSEIAKGPKLGGSRSARAAMHAAEKEKEKARGTGFIPGGTSRR